MSSRPVAARLAALTLALAAVAACRRADDVAPPPRYVALSSDLGALRSAFDADQGHRRLLLLLSPS